AGDPARRPQGPDGAHRAAALLAGGAARGRAERHQPPAAALARARRGARRFPDAGRAHRAQACARRRAAAPSFARVLTPGSAFMHRPTLRDIAVLCLIGAMWGGTFPALKIAVTHIPAVGVAAGRLFVAAVFMVIIALIAGAHRLPAQRD